MFLAQTGLTDVCFPVTQYIMSRARDDNDACTRTTYWGDFKVLAHCL